MARIVKVRGPLDPGVGEAARIIARGGIAVIPTETLYGLATNPLHGDAVEKVYLAKKRSPSKPLIVLASTPRAAASLVKWEPRAEKLAKTFWPGPLTIVLPAKPSTPPSLRGGGDTLGVRVPGNPVTLAILARAGGLAVGVHTTQFEIRRAAPQKGGGDKPGDTRRRRHRRRRGPPPRHPLNPDPHSRRGRSSKGGSSSCVEDKGGYRRPRSLSFLATLPRRSFT